MSCESYTLRLSNSNFDMRSISEFEWTESAMTIDFGSFLGMSESSVRSGEIQHKVDATFSLITQQNPAAGMVINVIYNNVNGFDADYCPRVIDKAIASIFIQRVSVTLKQFLNQGLLSEHANPLSGLTILDNEIKFNVVLKFQQTLCCGDSERVGDEKFDDVMKGAENSQIRIFTNLSREFADGSNLVSRYSLFSNLLHLQFTFSQGRAFSASSAVDGLQKITRSI